MLVLSRKVGERIVIAGNITVVVNRIAGGRVTLGIEAPSTVRVNRKELHDALKREEARAEAAKLSGAEPPKPRPMPGSKRAGSKHPRKNV